MFENQTTLDYQVDTIVENIRESISTDTMEERFDREFEAPINFRDEVKEFLRQEISLALQKRNEELVGKVQELIKENEVGPGAMMDEEAYSSAYETACEEILELLKQP